MWLTHRPISIGWLLLKIINMKVICIDASTDIDSELPVDLIEGQVYTVVRITEDDDGEVWYELKEKSFLSLYTQDGFMPTSGISETQFERNYNKELV